MGGFRNLRAISQNHACSYLRVRIIKIMLQVILNLVLVMVMVMVVWVIGTLIFSTIKIVLSWWWQFCVILDYELFINGSLKKYRFSNPLSQRWTDNFSVSVDNRGGIGPRTTYFYSQKVTFGRDRHNGGFRPYQSQCKG